MNLPKSDHVVARGTPLKKPLFLAGVECFYCHNKGHVQRDCRKKAQADKTAAYKASLNSKGSEVKVPPQNPEK